MGPSNDTGFTWGHYDATTIAKDGKSTTATGRYFTFWKKVHGEWKVALDASANEPPPTNGLPTPWSSRHPSPDRMGHVHLRVANLDRALAFYHDVLGFDITQRMGDSAAFLSAGGYHHHIGLNTWESLGGQPPPPGTTGLYHLAILYPTRAALADALRRLLAANIPLDGAADHGVSEALTSRTPTTTASSSTGIARSPNGPATPPAP